MKRRIKIIILTTIISLIGVALFIGFGLYTMEIEDHYGDLKELYYNSNSGEIIINKTTFEFGIIEKNWNRINVRTQKKDSTDLYNWIYKNGIETKSKIYRAVNGEPEINRITYSELKKRLKNQN
tara:strand:+ start:65 stop:436 length:372 start_codon:yes stop_codon:yes gene_type:complete